MSFVARISGASAVSDGVAGNARMNKAGEIVSTPWEYQMMLEGRVFMAGTGLEEAGVDGEAAINDTTPSWALVAPAGDVVVIPLFFRAYFDTEGGAAPDWHFIYVQADKSAYSAGTNMTAINALGGSNPRTAQGKLMNTLSSVTALSDAENVIMTERIHILDNFQSTEGATGKGGSIEFPGGKSVMELLWTPPCPIGLYAGSMVAFYTATATTDTKYNVAAAWIEIPANIYKP